jgi:hypothetical protein
VIGSRLLSVTLHVTRHPAVVNGNGMQTGVGVSTPRLTPSLQPIQGQPQLQGQVVRAHD